MSAKLTASTPEPPAAGPDGYHWYECEVPACYNEDWTPSTYWEGYHVQDEGSSDARMLQVQQEGDRWLGFVDGAVQVGTYDTLAMAKQDLEQMDLDVRAEEQKQAERKAVIDARRAAQPKVEQGAML